MAGEGMKVVETCQIPEQKEYNKEQCDAAMDQVERRINVQFPFVENKNGTYSYMRDNMVLDLDLNSAQIRNVHEAILKVLTYANQNDKDYYDDNFIVKEKLLSSGSGITFDNDSFINKEYLSNEWFESKVNNSSDEVKEKFANFLNKLIDKERVKYDNEMDTNQNELILENLPISESVLDSYFNEQGNKLSDMLSDIRNGKIRPDREFSLSLLKHIIENPVKPGYINSVDSFKSFTSNDIKFTSSDSMFRPDRDVSMQYDGGDKINVVQNGSVIGYYRLIDVNDQAILSISTGLKNIDDYKIKNRSSSKITKI